MKVSVLVKLSSKKNQIQPSIDGCLNVFVTAKPKNGEANRAIIKLLADYYDLPKSQIKIISGLTSRNKIIEIDK